MMADRGLRLRAVLVCALLSLPVGSAAQTPEEAVGVEIRPVQVYENLNSRRFATQVTVTNRDRAAREIRLFVRELGHDLDGTPTYTRSATYERIFDLDPARARLAPGARRSLELSGSIPADRASAYLGVVAEYGEGAGTMVETRFQVAAQFLLRGPKPWRQRISITDVGLLPGGRRERIVYATVKNAGNVHVNPTGVIEVRRGEEVIDTLTLEPKRRRNPPPILPTCVGGCTRRLQARWRVPAGLTGSLDLVARLQNPEATAARAVRLDPSEAGTPVASVSFIGAPAPGAVVARVTNIGNVTLSGVVVAMAAFEGDFQRARKTHPQADLPPGAREDIRWTTNLPDGRYRIEARVEQGGRLLARAKTRFVVGEQRPSRSLALLAVTLAGLALLGSVGVALTARRRLSHRSP